MTQIVRSADCGHSPKQKLLETLTVAIACRDSAQLSEIAVADVSWHPAGRTARAGLADVVRGIERGPALDELEIRDVVSHGRKGAVRGTYRVGGKTREFCHFVEFANANGSKIKHVRTISIAIG